MVSASLWVGEICMALGTIAFTLMSFRARPEDKHHYLTSIIIVVIATASYFAMSLIKRSSTVRWRRTRS
ncbi:MAG: hypothetical protein NVS2B8_21680 [Vulcanimicrobiaceae bacterium]